MKLASHLVAFVVCSLLVACPVLDDDDDVDIPGLDDDDDDAVEAPWAGCRSEPGDPDADRVVLVALPYDEDGGQTDQWAAMTLASDATMTDDGARLTAGRASFGDVAFTPDGAVAVAANDDGSLSWFAVDEGGAVTVVEAGLSGDFYASRVVMEPTGEAVWVIDGNWINNGGGLYRVPIDCSDGSPGEAELFVESKLAADLLFDAARDDRALVVALDVPGCGVGDEAALLPFPEMDGALVGADAFGDDEASFSDATMTADGRFALIGDWSAWSGIPNRVGVVELTDDGLVSSTVLPDVYDPAALVASPFDDAVLAVSGYGDAVFVISYDAGAGEFAFVGEPTYVGQSPQLPGSAALVARGALEGLVLVAENQGVRGVRFDGAGGVVDLGLLVEGNGMPAITGALGVQP
jgi:hypothetical protein